MLNSGTRGCPGTVLAVELKAQDAGYTSQAAEAVVRKLRASGVFTRDLGNVVYLMCTPTSSVAHCERLLEVFVGVLDSEHELAAAA